MKQYTIDEVQGYFQENDGLAKHLNVSLVEVSEKHAIASMPLEEQHKNGLDTAHGGAIFALADITFGAACAAAGLCCVTAQSSMSFLNTGLSAPIKAEVRLIKRGRTLMVYTVSVFDGEGRHMAQGQITGYKIGTFEELLEKRKNPKSK